MASPPKMIIRGTTNTAVKSKTLPLSSPSQHRSFIMGPLCRSSAGKTDDFDILPRNIHASLGRQAAEDRRPQVHVVSVNMGPVGEQDARGVSEVRRRDVRRKGAVRDVLALEGQVPDGLEGDPALDPRLPNGYGLGLAIALQRLGPSATEQPAQVLNGPSHLGSAEAAGAHPAAHAAGGATRSARHLWPTWALFLGHDGVEDLERGLGEAQ